MSVVSNPWLTCQQVAELVGLPATHSLVALRSHEQQRVKVQCRTRWYAARDASGRVVARYRLWQHQHRVPPYAHHLGWERYAPGGQLTDREVRYSRHSPQAYRH